jgi:hypothetical protein
MTTSGKSLEKQGSSRSICRVPEVVDALFADEAPLEGVMSCVFQPATAGTFEKE